MTARTLDAAGITDPGLRAAYAQCRGRASRWPGARFLLPRLLPAGKRPHLWALQAFANRCREVAASQDGTGDADRPLQRWAAPYLDTLGNSAVGRHRARPDAVADSRPEPDGAPDLDGETAEPVVMALVHTMRRWAIPRAHVEAHLEALQAAPERTGFASYADLERHLYGTTATIGLQVLPVLEPISPEAGPRARALAEGLQLITYVRDLRADMAAGRWYLPQDDLDAFALSRDDLLRGQVTPLLGELLAFECERARRLLAFAEPGVAMLNPTSRDCVRVTLAVGHRLLETIAEDGYAAVRHRVDLPPAQRMGIVLPAMRRARASRRSERHWVPA